MKTRTACSMGLVIGAIFLAGCGDSGSSSSASMTAAAAPAKTTAPAASATVDIADFMFGPATVTVAPGAKVTWTNHDSAPHTATATGAFDTATIRTGRSKSVTLKRAGRYPYVCAFHPSMKGTMIVQE